MAERWWWELKEPITDVQAGVRYDLKVKREAIPIIFLPGIMGSRLKQAKSKKVVWDPDRWGGLWMLKTYGMFWQRGGKKKEKLVGNTYKDTFLEVSHDDEDYNERLPARAPDQKEGPIERRWGGVMWSTYGAVLRRLASEQTWRAVLPLGLFFDFPVYAHGYNWTADVEFAAKELADRIKEVIAKHADQKCRQVILVTHSMGGLVARRACGLEGVADKVLGVVHGVQPVHGSGAGYWRMKGGFERSGLASTMSAWVLGTDGKEVTQTLAEMPGGLALLPNKLYGSDWLEVVDLASGRRVRMPASDPYQEIYREKERYWRLVNPDYLIGAKSEGSKNAGRASKLPPAASWDIYLRNLDLARDVHDQLASNLQHPETHFFSGVGLHSAGRIRFEAEEFTDWGNGEAPPPYPGQTFDRDGFTTYLEQGRTLYSVSMERPADDGDGTVPRTSAEALKQQGESHAFDVPGQGGEPEYAFKGMEHQPAYGEEAALQFTVNAVRRLCLLRMKEGGP